MKNIDPRKFGLHSSTIIEQKNENTFFIVINRKSRFIRSDAEKIHDKIQRIKSLKPGVIVRLKISSPMCSKAMAYLTANGIDFVQK